ncbi:hypothetical protein C2W62_35060 [Candidatus Entotheonella serta]|nr:hypothetical protein C2W62_35060 [Candidatus Entotheonella serta]
MLPEKINGKQSQDRFSLTFYLHHIRKRWWLVVLITLVSASIGALQVAKIRPLYRASARVLVEQKVMSGVSPFNNSSLTSQLKSTFHQTQLKLLKSRSLAREVIATLHLEQHPEFAYVNAPPPPSMISYLKTWATDGGKMIKEALPQTLQAQILKPAAAEKPPVKPAAVEMPPAKTTAVEAPASPSTALSSAQPIPNDQVALTNAFLQRLHIRPDLDSNLISLSFKAHDPELAASVPNQLAQLYMNQVRNKRFEEAHEGIDWLKARVEEMEKKVENSEVALERYKQENNTYSLDGKLPGVMQKLVATNNALTATQTERIQLEASYQQLQKMIERDGESQVILPKASQGAMIELQNRLEKLQLELDQLQQQYGPEHPQVVKVRVAMQAQQRNIDREQQRMIKVAKSRYEMLKARETALSTRYNELKSQVQDINEKAIRYGRLKRNVESNQRLAKVLVDRLGETNLNQYESSRRHEFRTG